MAIGLRIAWSGEAELNSLLFAKVLEVEVNELRIIVHDYLFGDPEAAYEFPSNEVVHFVVSDLVESFSLYPLGEVVGDCKHVDSLPGGCRTLPHYVHPPLHEGTR